MIVLPAHIFGIPVEETTAALAPVAAVTFAGIGATFRVRWRQARRKPLHRRARRSGEDRR